MRFQDRKDAGLQLAEALKAEKLHEPLLLFALPRGGVPVGAEIAKALRHPLDVIVTRKLGSPSNPEYAVGAMAETGEVIWNPLEQSLLSPKRQSKLIADQTKEAQRRVKAFRDGRPLPSFKGATVLIIDDGIATGYTMRAAIAAAKHQEAEQIVIVVPHGAKDTLDELRLEGYRVISLEEPMFYGAVGAFYKDFPQTEDEEVIRILTELRRTAL